MTSAPISVTIFDHSQEEHCSLCGIDRLPEAMAFVTEHLKRRYGDAVAVEYIDLAHSPKYGEAMDRIRAGNLPLPVVAIDGVFRLCGSVDYRSIVEAIETKREVGCG